MHFLKFVISLPSRADRRRDMATQLQRVGWNAEFIDAIRPADQGEFPSIGARGCFESHLKTLHAGRGSDIILMEDDLNFSRDFDRRWQPALDRLPDDWSIFYPASDVSGWPLNPDTAVLRAHMVVFRAVVIPRVIAELEAIMSRPYGDPVGGPMHVDGAYSTIRAQNPDIKTYALSPPLGYQRPSRTDIGETHWLDRYPSFARVARKVKTALINR
jgi:GR25 family glycosyltransferase involved in LPS biosynthesis